MQTGMPDNTVCNEISNLTLVKGIPAFCNCAQSDTKLAYKPAVEHASRAMKVRSAVHVN